MVSQTSEEWIIGKRFRQQYVPEMPDACRRFEIGNRSVERRSTWLKRFTSATGEEAEDTSTWTPKHARLERRKKTFME